MWRWLPVLLILATVSPAATADDLAKLKASLAERFASYSTLSVEFTTSVPDPVDNSKTIGAWYLWERQDGKERLEGAESTGDGPKAIGTFDGTRNVVVGAALAPALPTDISNYSGPPIARPGYAVIHAGTFSELQSQTNMIAWFLGLLTNETRSSLLDVLGSPHTKPIDPITVNGQLCSAWEVSGKLPDGGTYVGRLAVDVEAGWLPVQWETESTVPGERSVIIRQTVTESMEVVDEKSRIPMRVPRTGQVVWKMGDDPEERPQTIEFHRFIVGRPVSRERFEAVIPDGTEVRDYTKNKNSPREYISGGADAKRNHLARIAAQTQAMQENPPVAIINASIPAGPNWSLWLIVGAIILAVGSRYARRQGFKWWIWRWLTVLLMLATVTPAATADDLAKFKAALAERFSRYQSLSVSYITSGIDPDDPKLMAECRFKWDRRLPCERLELEFLLPQHPNRTVTSTDGHETRAISYPNPVEDSSGNDSFMASSPMVTIEPNGGNGLGKGEIIESILGLRSLVSPGGWPELLKLPVSRLSDVIVENGRSCPCFGVKSITPTGDAADCRIVVDPELDWLPVLMENRFTMGGRSFYEVAKVMDTMLIHDDRTNEDVIFPKVTKGALQLDEGHPEKIADTQFVTISISQCRLNPTFPSDYFSLPIPSGSYVQTKKPGNGLQTYVSGGPAVTRQILSEYQSAHEQQRLTKGGTSPTATPPQGAPWVKIILAISTLLLASAVCVHRRASR